MTRQQILQAILQSARRGVAATALAGLAVLASAPVAGASEARSVAPNAPGARTVQERALQLADSCDSPNEAAFTKAFLQFNKK